jgi:hypothetical protein
MSALYKGLQIIINHYNPRQENGQKVGKKFSGAYFPLPSHQLTPAGIPVHLDIIVESVDADHPLVTVEWIARVRLYHDTGAHLEIEAAVKKKILEILNQNKRQPE